MIPDWKDHKAVRVLSKKRFISPVHSIPHRLCFLSWSDGLLDFKSAASILVRLLYRKVTHLVIFKIQSTLMVCLFLTI
jgi:hypothetical protein